MSDNTIRLQNYLAARGVASRRGAATLIRGGKVGVDGATVTEPGLRIVPGASTITVEGAAVAPDRLPPTTVMLYKPRGFICSRAAGQGRTIHELVEGLPPNVVSVGRLDKDSEGLLLLSNDGSLVQRLTHPRYGQRKVYRVSVSGNCTPRALQQLRSRLVIDGYRIQPVEVDRVKQDPASGRTLLQFVLREGRNRQIRKMCEQAGLTIHRLVRTHVGALSLQGLRPGEWREVPPRVVAQYRSNTP